MISGRRILNEDSVREKIVDELRRRSTRTDLLQITDDTEIYYDLRLFGDDFYEFICWLNNEFGGDFRVNFGEYGPREGMPPIFFRQWRERRERLRHRYKSLRVGDILTAVELGHWPK